MLNALEVGTRVPIHRHLKTSETVVCLEGCLDWVFYEEMAGLDTGGPVHDGETAVDEAQFVETARFRVCPRDGVFGIQVPQGAWHSIEVHGAPHGDGFEHFDAFLDHGFGDVQGFGDFVDFGH